MVFYALLIELGIDEAKNLEGTREWSGSYGDLKYGELINIFLLDDYIPKRFVHR